MRTEIRQRRRVARSLRQFARLVDFRHGPWSLRLAPPLTPRQQVVQACEQQITHGEAFAALIDQLKKVRRHARQQDQSPIAAEQRATLERSLEHFNVAADGVRQFLAEPTLSEVKRCSVKGSAKLFSELRAVDGADALVPLELLQIANSMPRNRLNLELVRAAVGMRAVSLSGRVVLQRLVCMHFARCPRSVPRLVGLAHASAAQGFDFHALLSG